jgi:hypothetical protein
MTNEQYSPAAQAVSDAANQVYWDWCEMCPASAQTIAAAALRAAVDAVVPESKCYSDTSDGTMMSTDLLMVRRLFYAIAKELDEIK